ncbi:hypothetical protein NH26_09030 [Flammeovirga pacifica]|uniref:Zinc ribbon domain-containing protein n=2 Tax=Flammeovirga pacifica TaxID=915059 RepID=A0A1S1YZR4_FLAPC|nr:hypothetical protein NH26_09030 [Flammeovirga pacifica]
MSVEDEQESWKQAIADAGKVSEKYPSLKVAIDKQIGVANLAWDKALKVEDETAKILAMKAARTLITNGTPIITVKNYESNIEDLEDEIDKIKRRFNQDEFTEETQQLLAAARPVLVNAKFVPNDSEVTELHEALVAQNRLLEHNIKLLDVHYESVMEIRDLKEKKEKAEREALKKEEEAKNPSTVSEVSSTAAPAAKKEVKMVKCRKCGSKSPSTTSKCKSCGAKI